MDQQKQERKITSAKQRAVRIARNGDRGAPAGEQEITPCGRSKKFKSDKYKCLIFFARTQKSPGAGILPIIHNESYYINDNS